MSLESGPNSEWDAEPILRARYNAHGFAGLTENQKTFLCVVDLNSSEFTDYFLRSAAKLDAELGFDDEREPTDEDFERQAEFERIEEEWRDYAEAGLERIGAPQAAAIFREARTKLNWYEAEDQFRRAEDIDALLARFIETHPADFTFDD